MPRGSRASRTYHDGDIDESKIGDDREEVKDKLLSRLESLDIDAMSRDRQQESAT